MNKPARRFSFLSVVLAATVFLSSSLAGVSAASAQSLYSQSRYAAIVVDAASGEVLYARRADAQRYPASITKVMTLYLVFEALATGRLSIHDQVVLTRHAANQAPSKTSLRAGQSLSVDEAIRVVSTKSANDIAVALAEKLGGSEQRFAALMTLRAQELGMTNTRFVNASGLPDTRQISTARDIAILSRAVMRDYPQYYSYFGLKSTNFRGQTIVNHNRLLQRMQGMDGLKTGYINASGFNLAASAVRDGRRLIAVVLGGSSTAQRDENVEDLMTAGFDVLTKRKMGMNTTIAANMREPEDMTGTVLRPTFEQGSGEQDGLRIVVGDAELRPVQPAMAAPRPVLPQAVQAAPEPAKPQAAKKVELAAKEPAKAEPKASKADRGGYRIQVGAFASRKDASAHLKKVGDKFKSALAAGEPEVQSARRTYRARFAGFSETGAKKACANLKTKGVGCLVVAPS